MMKAVCINEVTPGEKIALSQVPIPKVKPGWVLIKIKAFGLNHSEKILRHIEIKESYIKHPIIPGIECVGEIIDPSDTQFKPYTKIVALMGGMGRSFDGSYTEYALLPIHHVFEIKFDLEKNNLTWEKIASIPETYFTAWGSLFECLDIKKEDILLIRGATCALGYAAINIAKAFGCKKIIATTHKEKKKNLLKNADEIIIDEGKLENKIEKVNKVLELIGPKTLLDSLKCCDKKGIVCQTGILGGLEEINKFDPIKDIPNGVYLTGFFSNYPTQEIIDKIFGFIIENKIDINIGKVYNFSNIKEAIIAQDNHSVDGKIVVTLN